MAVGPQYQSQLALLAGALGHGLDASTGLDLYQQTIAQAEAARQQRQAEIQATLGQLGQIATDAATSGQTPEQVQALVQATKAGLPLAQTQAVRHGVHGILANLADYQATPDPMAQAQLQGQLLSNAKAKMELQTGGLDVSQETVFGPAHQQEVSNLTQQYLQQGMPVQAIRTLIRDQMNQEFSFDQTGQNGIKQTVTPTGLDQAVQSTISSTVAQVDPQWAAQNLQAYANHDLTPNSGPTTPPPAAPQGNFAQQALSPSQSGGTWSSLADWTAGGASAGALAGLAGGPFAPVTVPAGIAAGSGIGFLGGLVHHFLS